MERNWLIRTTQKQILGPVAKSKVLEFLQKGALGLNDEVTSGNGYWFSLKEKDLVDKYLFGDVPQSYNPVSEAKSVLAKRDNPDKTTSLNATPTKKNEALKVESSAPGAIPKNDDLEYPDITMIALTPSISLEESKLPTSEDLEFPDISLITANINNSPRAIIGHVQSVEVKSLQIQKAGEMNSNEPLIYPEEEDLAYPDMGSVVGASLSHSSTRPNQIIEEDRDFKLDLTMLEVKHTAPAPEAKAKKSGSKDFRYDYEANSSLRLVSPTEAKQEEQDHEAARHAAIAAKYRGDTHQSAEDKKLLHERKVKASTSAATREMTKSPPKEIVRSALPEHLKKRNDNYLMYVLVILVLIILSLFFYYYRTILNKPLPV